MQAAQTAARRGMPPLTITDVKVIATAPSNSNWTIVTAATTIAVLPLTILFLAFQRHVVRSITITGFR